MTSVDDGDSSTNSSFNLELSLDVGSNAKRKKRRLVTLIADHDAQVSETPNKSKPKKRQRPKSAIKKSPKTETVSTETPSTISQEASEAQWMPKASRSGRTIKRRNIATNVRSSPADETCVSPSLESHFVEKNGTRPCERKGCSLEVPICFANEAPACASSRFTARWYHLSSGEHFCSDCYELYYRGKTVGNSRNFGSLFANWKRHWQANSRYIEGTMRTFVADQILPYWVECTRPDCRKWRQLGRSVELTPEYISKFTCGVIFYTGKSIHRSSKACDIPEDSRAIHIRNDFASGGSWMSTLSFVPLLKTSPAALFLYEYYPDGVGLSPSCELCKSTDEENRERHTNLLNGSPNKSQSPRSARASSSVARKSFVSVKIRRSQTKKGIASRSRATSANRSSHPYLETSPIKHLGGRVTTAITPIGVGSHLQPFYQPFESQKARAIRPDVMEPWELEAFPQYERMQYLYLGLRNTVIALWTLGPNQWLTLQEICKHVIIRGLVRIFSLQAVRQILYFLTIKSFVNVGILMKPGAGFLPPKFNRHKVIVIGAGPSGIAAARQLHNFGSEVIILEGRDRLGGRVWDDFTTTGVTVGQGAHIVVGVVNNPVTLMCHQSGLTLREMNSSQCDLIDAVTGKLLEQPLDEGVNSLFNAALDDSAKWRKGKKAREDESLLLRMQQWGHSLNHKDTELETRAFLFHVSNLEYACGSNLRHVSARSWDHNDRYDQFAGEHCLLVDGFQTLLTKLADGLDIKFGTCVKSIEYGQVHDINVTTSNDDTYLADKVIVTLPLRQLKDGVVKFTPPLPQEKLDAIEKLGAGKLEKIALRFKLNFWSEKVKSADFFGHVPASELDRGWFGVFYDLSPKETEDANNGDGPFVLMSWISGDAVDVMATMSDADIVAKCMRILRGMFDSVPDPMSHLVTRWSTDPMAGMAYSFVKVHGEGAHYDSIAESVSDKLYFAGEATQRRYPQTVTGALLSGFREAAKIVCPDYSDLSS